MSRQGPDALLLLQKVLAGKFDPDVQTWLVAGMNTWHLHGGDIALERCLHVPSRKQRRRARCAHHLGRALSYIDGATRAQRIHGLATQLDTFRTRGPWRSWEAQGCPDADASALQLALFDACASLEPGDGTSAKSIERLLRTDFPLELSADPPCNAANDSMEHSAWIKTGT